jgi:hypothetical protein
MSPQNLEPLSGATPYTPYFTIPSSQDALNLPLSREMALSVFCVNNISMLIVILYAADSKLS